MKQGPPQTVSASSSSSLNFFLMRDSRFSKETYFLCVMSAIFFFQKIGYLRASWAAGAEGAAGLALEKKKSSTILEGTSEYEE